MTWDYAELSKLAKVNGGPEKLIDILIEHGKEIGEKAGESKTLRRVGILLTAGLVVGAGIYKLIDYFSKKKAISPAEVEAAKKELIQGINDYDAAHADDDDETKEESDDGNEAEPDSDASGENADPAMAVSAAFACTFCYLRFRDVYRLYP